MILAEYAKKISEIDDKIRVLLKERESLLEEWNMKFSEETPENLSCIDDYSGNCHRLFLINEQQSMLHVCDIWEDDLGKDINEYYKLVDDSIEINSIAKGMQGKVPEVQKNLIYAKAAQLRNEYQENNKSTKIMNIKNYQRLY